MVQIPQWCIFSLLLQRLVTWADLYDQLHPNVPPHSILSMYFLDTLRGDRRVYSLGDETAVAVG